MAGNVKNMGLTSLDDLFKSEQERQQDTHERILNIPVGEIYPYVYLLRRYKRPTRKRISYEMRCEVLRLERYQAQFLYLREHGISTVEQLEPWPTSRRKAPRKSRK